LWLNNFAPFAWFAVKEIQPTESAVEAYGFSATTLPPRRTQMGLPWKRAVWRATRAAPLKARAGVKQFPAVFAGLLRDGTREGFFFRPALT